MKTNHITTVAAIAASGFLGQAAAQSGVTIAGTADAAVRYVSNEGRGKARSIVSGSNSTSRVIIRGVEDLGDGLSAGFHLEHGLLLDTGAAAQATQFWDRRSTVSLTSSSLGEVRLGRDFVPSYASWSRFDPFGYVGAASSSILVSATPQGPIRSAFGSSPNSTVRSSNALQALLPGTLGGLEGGLMLAFREGGAAANGQHKVSGARIGYVARGLNVSAGFTRSENDLTAATGAFKDLAVGGMYNFGFASFSVALRRFEHASARQTNLLLGSWVPVGANGQLKFSYNRANLAGQVGAVDISNNDSRLFGLGYVHSLSKRTALYGTVAHADNSGAATYAVPGGPSGMAGGGVSQGAEVGIRHVF